MATMTVILSSLPSHHGLAPSGPVASSCRKPTSLHLSRQPPRLHRAIRKPLVRAIQGDGNGGEEAKMEENETSSSEVKKEGTPAIYLAILTGRAKCIVGALILLSLPAWNTLKEFGDALKRVDKVVEDVADFAKKAENVAEHVAGDVSDVGMKKVVTGFEAMFEKIASKAKILDGLIDKVTGMIDNMEIVGKVENTSDQEQEGGEKKANEEKGK